MKRFYSIFLAVFLLLSIVPGAWGEAGSITLAVTNEAGAASPFVQNGVAVLEASTAGEVSFYDGPALIGTGAPKPGASGVTVCYALDLSAGTHQFQAVSGGNASNVVTIEVPNASPNWNFVKQWDFEDFETADLADGNNKNGISVEPNKKGTSLSVEAAPEGGTVVPDSGASPSGNAVKSSMAGKGAHRNLNLNLKDACTDNSVKGIRVEGDIFFAGDRNPVNVKKNPEVNFFNYDNGGDWNTGLYFNNGGNLYYVYRANNKDNFEPYKDASGKNMTYDYNTWYHVSQEFDFVNQTIRVFLNGAELFQTAGKPLPVPTYDTLATALTGGKQDDYWDTCTGFYFDNFSLSTSDNISVIPSVVTATLSASQETKLLPNQALTLSSAVTDSAGTAISHVDFYADGGLIAAQTAPSSGSTYSCDWVIPAGTHQIAVRAVNINGTAAYQYLKLTSSTIFPNSIFQDNMVLQRNEPIKVYGTGVSGEAVTVRLKSEENDLNGNPFDSTASCVVTGNTWEAVLPPQEACRKATLSITTGSGIATEYSNVAVGEVVVCAGQSNMANNVANMRIDNEADRDYPDIRLFFQDTSMANYANTEPAGARWTTATVANALQFSSTGFVAGKYYYLEHGGDVPVGLLYAAVGGTNIDVWMPSWAYADDPELTDNNTTNQYRYYNTMIAPLQKFTVGSVIWYQGESNTWYGNSYEKRLYNLITSWRYGWGDEALPFVIVQLPNNDYNRIYGATRTGLEIRAAQWDISKRLPQVRTVVSNDTGIASDVHPRDKKMLSKRIALALKQFDAPVEDFLWHPEFTGMTQEAGQVTLHFNNTGSGLALLDKSDYYPGFTYPKYSFPAGFEIRDGAVSGSSYEIVANDAEHPDRITFTSDTVVIKTGAAEPKVRYGWMDSTDPLIESFPPEVASSGISGNLSAYNLANSEGLPVAPFRTDELEEYNFVTGPYDPSSGSYNYSPVIDSITVDNSGGTHVIHVRAFDTDGAVSSVAIFADGSDTPLPGTAVHTPGTNEWTLQWTDAADGPHELSAVATDNLGLASTTRCDKFASVKTVSPVRFGVMIGDENYVLKQETVYSSQFSSYDAAEGGDSATVLPDGWNVAAQAGGTSYCAGRPQFSGEMNQNMLKLSSDGTKRAIELEMPSEKLSAAGNSARRVSIRMKTLFEGDSADAANASLRTLSLVTNNGDAYGALIFTNTEMRNYMGDTKKFNPRNEKIPTKKWFDFTLSVDLHTGAVDVLFDGVQYWKGAMITSSNADAVQAMIESLQSGVKAITFSHNGDNCSTAAATYIDLVTVTMDRYAPDSATEPDPEEPDMDFTVTLQNTAGGTVTTFDRTEAVTASAVFRKSTGGQPTKAVLMIACYDGSGRLLYTGSKTQAEANSQSEHFSVMTLSLTPAELKNAETVKAFLFDSPDVLRPLPAGSAPKAVYQTS